MRLHGTVGTESHLSVNHGYAIIVYDFARTFDQKFLSGLFMTVTAQEIAQQCGYDLLKKS